MVRIPIVTLVATLAVAAGALAIQLRAQTTGTGPAPAVDPALFEGLRYRLVGPSRGGRVTTVAGVPSQPTTFYLGVASGGVFKTTDSGRSWRPITDGQVPVGSTGAIAVAPSNPDVVYLGTGSDGVRSNVSTGRGVYRSSDAGATWTFAGLYDAGQIGAVVVHPANPEVVYVAANGDIFKANSERGVFKTTDGGRSWRKVLYLTDQVGAMDVELQPGNPDVVFAWMSRLERKPWTIISGSREGGFYKSTNGGGTFTKISDGLPTGLIGKGNVAVTAADPNRVYALIEAAPGGGMYRSDDAGQSWRALPSPAGMVQRPFYYTTLGADPTNADVVYGGAEGFWRSRDGGQTFETIRTPHTDNHDIWVSPASGDVMVQSNDGGANVSTDGGATWSTQMNQPTSELYGVWTDNEFPYNLYAAQQDNSTMILSSRAEPLDPASITEGPGCETGPLFPHPRDATIVYGNCKGQFSWLNRRTGQEKNYWVGGQSLYGNDGQDLVYRMQRVTPMATSPHDPDVLYYGSQYLHRTRDMGVTWERMSPDLTWFPPCCQAASGEPITRDVTGEEFYSTLYAITESPHEPGVIWTGANDGPFHITRDNGRTWANITPTDLGEGGRVQWIEASPHRRGSAYYAVYRYLLGDYRPYIYLTDDYGQSWTLLTPGTNGIPADWPARVVREDPDREGLLYAGTEFGLFISFDNGRRWQPFHLNMPHVPITDIKVFRKDLVVSTQGRGIWILDGLSAIHQVGPATSVGEARVFAPRDGYRTRVSPETLSPTIEYYLPAPPAGPVTIEIVDARGQPVNRYSSDAPAAGGRGGRGSRGGGGAGGRGAAPNLDPAMMAGRLTGAEPMPVARVTKMRGVNRFVWDVRHANGLPPAPGAYEARVTIDGRVHVQRFNLLIDPRLAAEGLTAADLQEQFDHNARMQAMVASVQQLVTDVQQALQQAQGNAARTTALQAVADTLVDQPVRYGKPGLRTHITYLSRMTTNVDMKVGRDALARADVLQKELDTVRAEFRRVR
ncbi:MAG TPA: hypothetical protein VMM93_06750 [Vicinamibacterales bacterium]|nr:hypothetical protein [Vicinamibacterales bacterium]